MSSTASNTTKSNIIDTVTATGMTIGDATATSILLGSSTAGRTPTIVIDTLSIANTNASPAIAIGTSSSTKTIKIGNTANSVHCSSIDLQGSAINNITAASGDVNIANNQTSGALNLATAASRNGDVAISNGNSNSSALNIHTGQNNTGSVNVGVNTVGVNSTTVNICSATNTVPASNTTSVNIATGNTSGATTIGNTLNTTSVNSGTLNIQNDATTAGTVNIKCGATSTGNINMKTGNTSAGSVNIANGTGATQTTSVNISSGSTSGQLTIGNQSCATEFRSSTINIQTEPTTTATTNIRSGTAAAGNVNIATGTGATQTTAVSISNGSTTGAVSIGNSANTTTLGSATTNVSGTLSMASNKNIILKTDGTYPAAGTQLGGVNSASILGTVPVSGSVYGTITISTAGIYIFTFGIYQNLSALGTTNYLQLGGSGSAVVNYGASNVVTNQLSFTGTQVIQATASNYTLTLQTSSVCLSPVNQGGYFQAIRIG